MSVAAPAALVAVVEDPPDASPHARDVGRRAAAHVPRPPRSLTPRMRRVAVRRVAGPLALMTLVGAGATAAGIATGGALTVGAVALLGGAFSWSVAARRMRVLRRGLATYGVVTDVREVTGRERPIVGPFVVDYTYRVRGEDHHGFASVGEHDAREMQRQGVVALVYDPADAAQSAVWFGAVD